MPQQVESSFLEVFALGRAVGRLLHRACAASPLSPTEYGLTSIVALDGESTVTSIAERLSVPITTASDWVHAALAKGYLVRERSDEDARRFRLALTDDGLRAHAATAKDFQSAFERFRSHATAPEAELLAVLGGMRAAVDAAAGELAQPDDERAASTVPLV